ncbi:MBL fold metallo-hydrolase [Gorillibacterium massiliense]|uniref:MBL fold metallo-hydrolase n=1 Tax=Gorillibacterium massiliense TaxID=1280390 RepID=UPI0004BC4980|nr:MBL fold metallo-hydrolase [Gorillibacterium massiliense]
MVEWRKKPKKEDESVSYFERISPHIDIMHAEHETDRPILAAVQGRRRTLLIDAGNSPKHAALFRAYLREQNCPEPDLLALTHWHWDHTFAMSAWGVPAVAHHATAQMLARLARLHWSAETLRELENERIISDRTVADIRLEYKEESLSAIAVVEPDISFQDRLTLDLGGVTCEILHVGGDHSVDCCYLYVPEDRTLFLGDALGPSVYGGPMAYTSASFLRLMTIAEDYDAEVFVESHGKPLSRADFLAELAPYKQLAQLAGQIGNDRDKLAAELKNCLGAEELPADLERSIDFFIAGFADAGDSTST